MIYYKFCAPMRGTRKIYLYSQAFTAVNGIIEFEEEPSPNIRIALGMRRYRRVEDSVKAMESRSKAHKAPVAPDAHQKAPEGDSGASRLVKDTVQAAKRVFQEKKRSKRE